MVVIIDYQVGNITAVLNMLDAIGVDAVISSDPEAIHSAEKIILPGIGSFDSCVLALRETGLVPLIEKLVLKQKVPILGICVGAQILGLSSEEGVEKGLGWIDMKTQKFDNALGIKVPHMGWADIFNYGTQDNFFLNGKEQARFYFAHSFFMAPRSKEIIWATAFHGIEFAAAVNVNNIYGVQFHPEKSHIFGKRFLQSFVEV